MDHSYRYRDALPRHRLRRVTVVIVAAAAIAAGVSYRAWIANRTAGADLAESTAVAKRFVRDLQRGNYPDAVVLMSDNAHTQYNAEALRQEMSALSGRYGAMLEADAGTASLSSFGGLETCRLRYTLVFARGREQLSVMLARANREWLVDSIVVERAE